ncbi:MULTISPECIES: hypothetical protein [Pseudomonas]|uniref:hypothetical protein n=1 Tax=Pseudomonas TaxID=286 RepID=UPI0011A8E7F0|nr:MULTISPECIES: hypothetical protein [Pseudomonas]MBI6927224.1 hypothetical protein [Pseudomonas putida]
MLKSMMLWISILVSCGLQADGVVVEERGRDLYVRSSSEDRLFKNIFGDKDGVARVLVSVNGRPAIFVLGRASYYYTLGFDGSRVTVDCVYVDGRNKYNGARILVGECGLDTLIDSSFYEVGMELLAEQSRDVYSFSTNTVANGGGRYVIGEMSGIEFIDEYLSEESLIGSRPVRMARWKGRCYKFDADLVFLTKVEGKISYVDVVRSVDPIRIQRLDESDVRRLMVDGCL